MGLILQSVLIMSMPCQGGLVEEWSSPAVGLVDSTCPSHP